MASGLSVVIPSANRRPEFLRRAIDSVLGQERPPGLDLELIVANNSSRPLPADVLELESEARLRCVAADRVIGAGHARNRGAAVAKAERLAFLDDDDWWEPTFAAELTAALERERVDLVLCGFWTWRAGEPRIPGKQMKRVPTVAKLYLGNPGIRGSNFVIRREVYEAVGGFDESLPTSNDKDFLIRLLRRGYQIHPLERRLVNLERGGHERLTQARPIKVAGTRRFLELHGSYMTEKARRQLSFNLRLQQALTQRSYRALCWLAAERPGEATEIWRRGWAMARGRHVRV